MTQWYSCNASEAMNGKGYTATRAMPQLEFFEDGTPMDITVDVQLYGYVIVSGTVYAQFEVGYYKISLRQWLLSYHDNINGFIPIAWAYLPDVPSIYGDAVNSINASEFSIERPNAEKSPDLVTKLYNDGKIVV